MRSLVLIAVAPFLLSSTAICQTTPTEKTAGAFGPPSAGTSTLDQLPLQFVENRGQWDSPAQFVARRGAMTARLEGDAIVLELRRETTEESVRGLVLRLVLEGASKEVRIEGDGLQRGPANYFLGSDPERWTSAVPGYSRVFYRGLHDGVDLCVRDHQGRLEYDLLLAAGADLDQVTFRAEGAGRIAVGEDGSLSMETELGSVRQSAPRTWYELPSGEVEEVECRFVALGGQRYGFTLPDRKPGLPVVIDPGLEWSTYLGASDDDQLLAIAVDPGSGHLIVGGRTYSTNFPVTPGAYDTTHNGGTEDAILVCLDPNAVGSAQLVWSTFLGGSARDRIMDLRVDGTGAIYLVGHTSSSDFPTTPGAYDTTHNGGADTFVARIGASGTTLTYSTLLGGSLGDWGVSLALLGGNSVAIAGSTTSGGFPTTAGAYQPAIGGWRDAFACTLSLAGGGPSDLQYSTFLGGSLNDGPALDITYPANMHSLRLVVGSTGDLVVAGGTFSSDFPTRNAYDTSLGGTRDVFVTRLNPAGGGSADLLYSSYLGGNLNDGMFGLNIDSNDVIVVGGWTYSPNFPTTATAYSPSFYGPSTYNDAFVTWLDTSQTGNQQLLYSTFLSGDGWEGVDDIVFDGSGGVIVGGYTGRSGLTSNAFPITCGSWQPEFGGNWDGFITRLTPAGNGANDLLYSTFLGGATTDIIEDLILDSAGPPPVVLGLVTTNSTDFPTTPGAWSGSYGGPPWDAVLFRLDLTPGPWTYCVSSPNSVGPGASIGSTGSLAIAGNTFTLTVTGAVPNQFGIFFYGKGASEVPFGDGLRCVTGAGFGIHRLNPPALTDGGGGLQRLLDFTQPPAGSGVGQIDPGTAWNFQFWYRDPNGSGGSGFNLSDALRATFCP